MRLICFAFVVALLVAFAVPSLAGDLSTDVVLSTKSIIGVGVVSCLADGGAEGLQNAAKMSEAVALSVETARTIKSLTGSGFPSGHAAGAFAAATSMAKIHPNKKWLYYGVAAVVTWSTVDSEAGGHTWSEALAGAALGFTVAKTSMSHPDGFLIGKVISKF